jgi:hypothetical protein
MRDRRPEVAIAMEAQRNARGRYRQVLPPLERNLGSEMLEDGTIDQVGDLSRQLSHQARLLLHDQPWVFSGETNDVTTVEKVKTDLAGWRLGRCVFVGDAGMNSEDNRRSLALGNGKYILASKMLTGDEVTRDVLARPGRYHDVRDNLQVKEVIVGDGERRRRSKAFQAGAKFLLARGYR